MIRRRLWRWLKRKVYKVPECAAMPKSLLYLRWALYPVEMWKWWMVDQTLSGVPVGVDWMRGVVNVGAMSFTLELLEDMTEETWEEVLDTYHVVCLNRQRRNLNNDL